MELCCVGCDVLFFFWLKFRAMPCNEWNVFSSVMVRSRVNVSVSARLSPFNRESISSRVQQRYHERRVMMGSSSLFREATTRLNRSTSFNRVFSSFFYKFRKALNGLTLFYWPLGIVLSRKGVTGFQIISVRVFNRNRLSFNNIFWIVILSLRPPFLIVFGVFIPVNFQNLLLLTCLNSGPVMRLVPS